MKFSKQLFYYEIKDIKNNEIDLINKLFRYIQFEKNNFKDIINIKLFKDIVYILYKKNNHLYKKEIVITPIQYQYFKKEIQYLLRKQYYLKSNTK